jgi:hypothetical protein
MKSVIKTLLVVLVVASGSAFFLRNYFLNIKSSCFPDLGAFMYSGIFLNTASSDIEFANVPFIIAGSDTSDTILFSLAREGYEPQLVTLHESGSGQEVRGLRGEKCFDPAHIETESGVCRLYGELKEKIFTGSMVCRDRISVDFKAKFTGHSPLIAQEVGETEDSSSLQVMKVMADISSVEKSKNSVLHLKAKRTLLSDELGRIEDAMSNSEDLKSSIEEMQTELKQIEQEIQELEQKKGAVTESRNQLFRVTERGVEIELERRLARMEYDAMSRELSSQDASFSDMAGEYSGSDKEYEQFDQRKNGQGDGNEWWKVLE